MPKSRRLSDLYLRGTEVEIDDGEGAVTVWLAKPNSIERESVFRRAQAAKARFMIEADDENGDLFIEEYGRVREYGDRDSLVMLAISDDLQHYRERVEAELSTDEETWGKEGYLQGLVDSWTGTPEEPGLAQVHQEDPDDAEALRVKAEIDRFDEQLSKMLNSERDRLMADWVGVPDEKLWRTVAHFMLEQKAMEAFIKEVSRQQLFFAVREPTDHKTRYFGTLQEIDDLDDAVREQLNVRLNDLYITPSEGKDLPGTQDSSPSSEPPAAVEDPSPSGPETVNA